MKTLRYLHLDVFTSNRFEGNQLAVFPDPGELPAGVMQAIAREMAFSETTFIAPATGEGDVRMRIFTPGEELPIAGHPTIGSTFALAEEGTIDPGRASWTFELGVGPTPVDLEWNGQRLAFAWMTQPLPAFGPTIADIQGLALALGIDPGDIRSDLPPQRVSCGVPFLLVALASRAAVDATVVDRARLAQCCRAAGFDEVPVFFFSLNDRGSETAYSRMIAPGFGIAEDPATGGASGPLGAYLLHHRGVPAETARSMISLQGVAMGRPSRIHISIEGKPDRISRVRVGGQSVVVGRGELTV